MRILVTGGNGFIGSTVVRLLHERGYTVRCTLRKTSNTERLNGIPFEQAIADIRDKQSLEQASIDCDAIIHCASLSNWKDLGSPKLESIIVGGTQNILEISQEKQIRMVYLSSAAALGASMEPYEIRGPDSPFNLNPKKYRYAAYKARAETLCLEAGNKKQNDVVVVHPTETYGPGDTQLVTASTLMDFSTGPVCLTCKGGTSVVHVKDVAMGIIAALERGQSGEKYILGGENVSISELASITQEINGTHFPEIKIPCFLIRIFVNIFTVVRIPALQPLLMKYRYATHYWYFDNSKSIKHLGITFRSAKDTLADTLSWLKVQNDE